MATGLLITRIVLACFMSGVTYSSVLPPANLGDPKALQDGQKIGLPSFGTRRPLHYIRALRGQSKSPQVKDLRYAQVQKQIPSPSQPQKSPPQRNYTTAKPRGFALNLDVPGVFDLFNQNKGTGSTTGMSAQNHGADSKHSPGFPIPMINILGNRRSTKDPYTGENAHGDVKPSFQLGFSVPSQAPSKKSSQNGGGHFDLEPENLHSQNKLTKSEKQLGSTQTGLNWPFLNYLGRHEQGQLPTALPKLPIMNNIVTKNQQTQPREFISTQTTNGKLTISPGHYSQPTRSQQLNQDKANQQNWAFQRPAINDPPSLILQKYPDHIDLYNAHTSFPRHHYDDGPNVQDNPTKMLLSLPPQDFNSVPSKGSHSHIDGESDIDLDDRPTSSESQSSLKIHGSLNKSPMKDPKGEKSGHESPRNFELSFSVSIPAKSPNIAKTGGRHSNIKFGTSSDGSGYVKPLRRLSSVQIGSNWPDANIDSMHQETDLGLPVLHHDAGRQYPQQQVYEHVPSKSTDGRLTDLPWHLSQHAISQNSQDAGRQYPKQQVYEHLPSKSTDGRLTDLPWHLSQHAISQNSQDAGRQYPQQQVYEHVPSKSTDGRLTDLPWHLSQHAISQNSQDAGRQYPQQQVYEHVLSKSTDGRLTDLPWHLSQHASSQNSQDKPRQNWAFQGLSITKPPAPVLPLPTLTKHEGYGSSTRPRKFEVEGVDFYHSWVKPNSEGNSHHLTGHSDGMPPTFATEAHEYNQLKPSVGRTQTMETMYHWSPPQSSFRYDPRYDSPDWVDDTLYELGKLQKGQRQLSAHPYQYNSERAYNHQDASDPEPESVIFSPGYHTQKKFPAQDANSHDEKGKFDKPFINVGSGDGGIDGQTYFTTQNANKYPVNWTGKNMAEASTKTSKPYVNRQVSVNQNSLKRPHDPHYGDKPLSHVQLPCIYGVGDCSPEPEGRWQTYNIPEQLDYSPFTEATAVSIPRRPFQRAVSESSPHRIRNAYGVQQYPRKPQQLAYYK